MTGRAELAIFVGGKSTRMGTAKGLLSVPGLSTTIVEHLAGLARDEGLVAFLVGDAQPYDGLVADLQRVGDDPPGGGPLAGLHAALAHVGPGGTVIAVACDMPYVTADVIALLRDHPTGSPIVASRRTDDAPWEPMLARYEVDTALPRLREALADGCRSFQQFFRRGGVEAIELTPALEHALEDWDAPGDVVP